MMAIRRTLSVFHWRVSYNPHTCRSNVSVRKTTVIITELSPKFAPTNETLLFLLLLNSVQHPPWVRGKLLSISNVLANLNYTMQNCLARNANSFLFVSRAVPLSEVGAPQPRSPAESSRLSGGSQHNLVLPTAKSNQNQWATTPYLLRWTGLSMLVPRMSRSLHRKWVFSAWIPPCIKNSSS